MLGEQISSARLLVSEEAIESTRSNIVCNLLFVSQGKVSVLWGANGCIFSGKLEELSLETLLSETHAQVNT